MTHHYRHLLEKYPLRTKAVTNGLICTIGDAINQCTFGTQPFNWKRSMDFFIIGFGYFAPVLHTWYSKLLPRIQQALFSNVSNAKRVMGSMLFDQLVFAPAHLVGFFVINQMIKDRDFSSFGKGVDAARQKIWVTCKEGWKFWPIATTINLWLIPVQFQVLFVNLIGIFWNIFLSYIAWK